MRKQLVFVMQNLKFGGAEKSLLTYLQHFDRDKYQVTLVLHTREGELLQQVPDDVAVYGLVPRDDHHLLSRVKRAVFFRILKYWPGLLKLVHPVFRRSYAVTVGFMEGLSTELAALFRGPKIAWVHTDVQENDWADRYFRHYQQQRIYRQFNEIVFVSQGSLHHFNDKFTVPNTAHERVIHNPIDLQHIRAQADRHDTALLNWHYDTTDSYRIVTVGRLDPVKRIDLLIQAVRQLNDRNLTLTVVGDGPELGALHAAADGADNIFFVGFQRNPIPFVKASDLFVSTSQVESYPTAIIEALVVHTPVLATANIGVREVLHDSAAVLPATISAADLADRIHQQIVTGDQTRSQESVATIETIPIIMAQYDQLFEEVMSR